MNANLQTMQLLKDFDNGHLWFWPKKNKIKFTTNIQVSTKMILKVLQALILFRCLCSEPPPWCHHPSENGDIISFNLSRHHTLAMWSKSHVMWSKSRMTFREGISQGKAPHCLSWCSRVFRNWIYIFNLSCDLT